MKKDIFKNSLLSLATITLLFSGCGETATNDKTESATQTTLESSVDGVTTDAQGIVPDNTQW